MGSSIFAFETPEQEINKFVRRLIKLGAPSGRAMLRLWNCSAVAGTDFRP